MEIGKVYKHKLTNNKFKVLKLNKNFATCLNIKEPKKIFWFKEIDNISIIRKDNLIEIEKPVQKSLF